MSVDPLRDQLAANCDAPRDSVEWERADEAYRDYVEAKARRDLAGPQPPAEDIRNALQILQGADEYITDADSRFHGDGEGYRSLARPDHDAVVRLLKHALEQLEGSPLRAPQEAREP